MIALFQHLNPAVQITCTWKEMVTAILLVHQLLHGECNKHFSKTMNEMFKQRERNKEKEN